MQKDLADNTETLLEIILEIADNTETLLGIILDDIASELYEGMAWHGMAWQGISWHGMQ